MRLANARVNWQAMRLYIVYQLTVEMLWSHEVVIKVFPALISLWAVQTDLLLIFQLTLFRQQHSRDLLLKWPDFPVADFLHSI